MRFTLTLVARSGRWIAPALVYGTWLLLVVANPGTGLENASALFFGVVLLALWVTVMTGNVDDDPHRDLCAATAGSPARLQVTRQLAALAATLAIAVVSGAVAAITGTRDHHSAIVVVTAGVALLASAALIGAAIGGFLHRPIIQNLAWSVVLAVAAAIAVALLPPVHDVLRDVEHARLGPVYACLAAALLVASVSAWLSAALVQRRS